MLLRSARLLHTTRPLFQVEVEGALSEVTTIVKGSGKKKPPKKQNLVILNASQSKLFQRNRKGRRVQETANDSKDVRQQLRETSMMLNFVPVLSSTPEQIYQAISALKPVDKNISEHAYKQLVKDLKPMFTLDQFESYIKAEYPDVVRPRKVTMDSVIETIIKGCWLCQITSRLESEFIAQRSFDLTKKQMFLLLSQTSIIGNWMRANVKILLFSESLQMIVRAPEAHIQYIELALASIFKNVKSEEIDLGKVKELFAAAKEEMPMNDIQTLTGVFFEQKRNEDNEAVPNEYVMSSLGSRKFEQAKRLILWSLDYNPFTKVNIHLDLKDETLKLFRQCPDNSLPWIHRTKEWMRLREPKRMIGLPKPIELDSSKIYEELYTGEKNANAQTVTAVSFGQLLIDRSTINEPHMKITMNTDIPFANEKIHKLPLYGAEGEDSDVTADNHIYYAQIKLVPSPFNKTDNYMDFPPVEFWVETDQDNSARLDTFQVLCVTNERNSIVSLPSYPTDVKFVRSDTQELIEPFENNKEDWLSDQPGVKRFLEDAVLDFSGNRPIKVPQYCDIIIPGHEKPVRYDYVNMTHRKQIDLEFKNRLLTCAVLEGGSLGGRTTEVILVGKDKEMTKGEFEEFVEDSKEFVKSLNLI